METFGDKAAHHWNKLMFRLFRQGSFKSFGRDSTLLCHLQLHGTEHIEIGDRVYIHKHAWLATFPLGEKAPLLRIGSGTVLGNFNHITATGSVVIGANVLTADRVYISDHIHGHEDIARPVKEQPIIQKAFVMIGDGAFLGENVCVVGASVGKNAVIGSNSVVTRDIPDYCVAVGSPAKVIKRYDFETHDWRRV